MIESRAYGVAQRQYRSIWSRGSNPLHSTKLEARQRAHRRVVGPLPRLEVERATTNHVNDWLESAGTLKLEGGTKSVARRQTEQTPLKAIGLIRVHRGQVGLVKSIRHTGPV